MKWFVLFFTLAIFLLPFATAGTIVFDIVESGKITSFYDDFYVVNVDGVITIYNQEEVTLNNLNIPYNLFGLELRSNATSSGQLMTSQGLIIFSIEPQSSISLSYNILGITSINPIVDGEPILAGGIFQEEPEVYTDVFGQLLKNEPEVEAITGRDRRLISVHFENPTSFNLTLDLFKVTKTSDLDITRELESWDFTGEVTQIGPGEFYAKDFFDEEVVEGEIYWLQADVFLDASQFVYNRTNNISLFTEDDLINYSLNASVNGTGRDVFFNSFLLNNVFLRKTVSSTQVLPGDVIDVKLILNNFDPLLVSGKLTDEIPSGFEIIDTGEGTKNADGSTLTWDMSLNPRKSKRVEYAIKYVDEDSLGVDFFPAGEFVYGKNRVYSSSLPFIRQYIPEKKLFVQKSVAYITQDEIRVTLNLLNLGESPLEDLVVKELIPESAEFREISQPFTKKGVWVVDRIDQGESWITSYVTDSEDVLNTLPSVFGVPMSSVRSTILLVNIIESRIALLAIHWFELVGLASVILFLLVYLLPANYFSSSKRKQVRSLKQMHERTKALKSHISSSRSGGGAAPPIDDLAKKEVVAAQATFASQEDALRQQRYERIKQSEDMIARLKQKVKKQ
ncbi:MAG: DUF11 domain-containing protein [Candidatus Woesearchaeota archaeon]|nr:MAG: DUF11 domain-containing protein [Candidatus Woesearchaeota archaeon]